MRSNLLTLAYGVQAGAGIENVRQRLAGWSRGLGVSKAWIGLTDATDWGRFAYYWLDKGRFGEHSEIGCSSGSSAYRDCRASERCGLMSWSSSSSSRPLLMSACSAARPFVCAMPIGGTDRFDRVPTGALPNATSFSGEATPTVMWLWIAVLSACLVVGLLTAAICLAVRYCAGVKPPNAQTRQLYQLRAAQPRLQPPPPPPYTPEANNQSAALPPLHQLPPPPYTPGNFTSASADTNSASLTCLAALLLPLLQPAQPQLTLAPPPASFYCDTPGRDYIRQSDFYVHTRPAGSDRYRPGDRCSFHAVSQNPGALYFVQILNVSMPTANLSVWSEQHNLLTVPMGGSPPGHDMALTTSRPTVTVAFVAAAAADASSTTGVGVILRVRQFSGCPPDWRPYGGYCFGNAGSAGPLLSFDDSQTACVAMRANLLHLPPGLPGIETITELYRQLPGQLTKDNWIGLTDYTSAGQQSKAADV
uniref:CUB domain-containing protein n=1 Tax=Macrostomum lignano TaxID=282301 RepID=A0A1I8GG32_9PLAT